MYLRCVKIVRTCQEIITTKQESENDRYSSHCSLPILGEHTEPGGSKAPIVSFTDCVLQKEQRRYLRQRPVELILLNNLIVLRFREDIVRVILGTMDLLEHLECFFDASLGYEPPGRLGYEQIPSEYDNRRDQQDDSLRRMHQLS
jgi:hypothetical protein